MIYNGADAKAFENMVILQSGTLDVGLDSLVPEAELWVRHRPEWLPELAGVAQMREFE